MVRANVKKPYEDGLGAEFLSIMILMLGSYGSNRYIAR